MDDVQTTTTITTRTAFKFVLLLGVISLFADVTYEGARSITGPYMALLGASAAIVGFVAGFGELVGYALRLVSGYLVDKTARYWMITFLGYFLNLLAVPLLALTNSYKLAAILIILERAGKAVRTPARDAMLSYASRNIGTGWGFGIHESLDSLGAMIGPLLIAGILFLRGSYQEGFAILAVPAVFALITLTIAWRQYPHPRHLDASAENLDSAGISGYIWWYLAGASLIAAGYVDYPLIAFHFKQIAMPAVWIPMMYAVAMCVNSMSSLIVGYLYDHQGKKIFIFTLIITPLFAPLVFWGNIWGILIGMMLWGIGMAVQSSILKALIADLVPQRLRGSAYGIFNTGFGIAWFLGSALMGILYGISFKWLVLFSVVTQLMAVPIFVVVGKRMGWFGEI